MFMTRLINEEMDIDADMGTAMHYLSLSPNGEHHNQHIPNEDECPCYLDTLNLRRRNLEHPSEILHYLSSYANMSDLLVELDLSRNGLSDLPLEINQLANIRQLNLACNRFTKLPSVLYALSNLKHLDITENQLTNLDNLPLALQNLQTLRASGNRLERLDDRLDLWASMNYLQLGSECGGNRLVDLPESLAQMTRLEELELSNNQIQNWRLYLPSSLKHLKLSGNYLTGIPADLLICCPKLETLDMSSNRLSFLPSMIGNLTGNTSSPLQRLDLSNNNIYIVPTTIFIACPHVILVGNPALEYHRKSTTYHAQQLRDLSNIAVYSSPNVDFCLDLTLIELLDQKPTLFTPNNPGFFGFDITDDTHDNTSLEAIKNCILATLSRWKNVETDNPYPETQGKVFTSKGESWIPSLQELAMRSAKTLWTHQTSAHKTMPCALIDDIGMESACSICYSPCVNEWLSAIQVCAYQAYYSVVCKVALCSTACWLIHHRKTRAPAASAPDSFSATPVAPTINPEESSPLASLQSLDPDSFEWIVAAATASATQLEDARALE